MKVLLDTSFIRNLQKTEQLGLLSVVAKDLNLEFYIPTRVKNELQQKSIPEEIQILVNSNNMKIECCDEVSYQKLSLRFFNLGEGELEAICIVDKCEDRTFKNYIIMTDDEPAQKIASSLGMSTWGTIAFLFTANQKCFIKKEEIIASLRSLEKDSFFIDPLVMKDIMSRIK